MSVFYKKVDAVQLLLTNEELDSLKTGSRFEFEGQVVKYAGGLSYFAMLRQGENQIKVTATQWVIRHPEGAWQVLWPHEFMENFIPADHEKVAIILDAFSQVSYNQPTAVI